MPVNKSVRVDDDLENAMAVAEERAGIDQSKLMRAFIINGLIDLAEVETVPLWGAASLTLNEDGQDDLEAALDAHLNTKQHSNRDE